MKILEQILKDIDEASVCIDNYYVHRNGQDDGEMYVSLTKAKEIIRSHMEDDGWIPVEERLPKSIRRYLVTGVWEVGNWKKYSVYDATYGGDGIWHTQNYEPVPYRVVAWKHLPEPYQPKEGEHE